MSSIHPSNGYEFSTEENRLIAHLARKMTGVGVFLALVASISGIAGVASLIRGSVGWSVMLLFASAFFGSTGLWSARGGRLFRSVVDTQGDDIGCVMRALAQLDHFYTLNFWLVILYIAVVLSSLLGSPVH